MTSVLRKPIWAHISAETWEQLEEEQASLLPEHHLTWKLSGLWEGWS